MHTLICLFSSLCNTWVLNALGGIWANCISANAFDICYAGGVWKRAVLRCVVSCRTFCRLWGHAACSGRSVRLPHITRKSTRVSAYKYTSMYWSVFTGNMGPNFFKFHSLSSPFCMHMLVYVYEHIPQTHIPLLKLAFYYSNLYAVIIWILSLFSFSNFRLLTRSYASVSADFTARKYALAYVLVLIY